METLFTYFIKVSVLVALFYLSYHFLLKRETFFSKNRLFLLLGLVTSVILPIVTITKIVWVEPVVFDEPFILSDFSNEQMPDILYTEVQQSEINWSYIVAGFYLLGMLFFLVKFILSSLSLYKILHKSPNTKQNGFKFINSKNVKTPFSFFNYIAFDSSSFSEEELQNIITHEKVHSKQKHSFDIILSEIFSVVFWLNPFVWLYKKAIQQNLEFIADNKAVKTSENKVNYQKTLLKITLQPQELALANPFFQPLIKKRIIMLNKNQSKNKNLWKFTFILPILVVFVMQFQTKVVAQEKITVISQEKEQQYKLPTSVDWEYANDSSIFTDTLVWVKDFSKAYEDEMENQSTREKNIVKINSWEDVKKLLKIEPENNTLGKNPLILINGQDISEFKKMKIEEFDFEGLISIITYTKQEAIEKFGEKAKDGAIIIEGEITNLNIKTSSKSNNQEDEVNSPEFQKKIKEIERRAKEIEAQANSPEFQKKIKEIERKAKEIEAEVNSPEFQKKIKEMERRAKEDEVNKTVNKWEISSYEISTRNNSSTSIIINKNTSDKQIKEYTAQFESQNIQMKVSNLKRNKNGEITKIKISLIESSGTENNKRKAKTEATFERKNEAIPNIFVGKQNGNLIVSSSIK